MPSRAFVDELNRRLENVALAIAGRVRPRVTVLEWTDPPFDAGHWIPDMVDRAGGASVLGEKGRSSRQVAWEAIARAEPEVCIVAPCGYHLDDARRLATELISASLLPVECDVWAVDADSSFVRPGPRLVDGVEALAGIFHPGVIPMRVDLASYIGSTSAKTKPSRSTISPTATSIGWANPGPSTTNV